MAMNKAILVIDMPKCCRECPVCASYAESAFSIREYWCTPMDNRDAEPENRPNWCPLKEVPDQQDKFITLPLNVGDVVWTYLRSWRKEDGIAPYQITNLTITQNKKGVWTKKYRAMWVVDGKTRDWSHDFSFDEIGKTTFLSCEEAEAVLINEREVK